MAPVKGTAHDIAGCFGHGRVGACVSTALLAADGAGAVLKAIKYARAAHRLNEPAEAVGNVLPSFPTALSGGPANTHVYLGIKNGKPAYVGITNNIGRRSAQHGTRFDQLQQLTTTALTRGQARAVEEALILRNAESFSKREARATGTPSRRVTLQFATA